MPELLVGQSATVGGGDPLDSEGVTLTGRTVVTEVSDETVLELVGDVVTAIAPGTARVCRRLDERTAEIEVTVPVPPPADEYDALVADVLALGGIVRHAYLADDGLTPGGNWVCKVSGVAATPVNGGLAYDPVTKRARPAVAGGYNQAPEDDPIGAVGSLGGRMLVYIGNTNGTAGRGIEYVDTDPAAAVISGSVWAVTGHQASIQPDDTDTSANKVRTLIGGAPTDLGGNTVFAPHKEAHQAANGLPNAWGLTGTEEPISDDDTHCITFHCSGDRVTRVVTMDGWRSNGSQVSGTFMLTPGGYTLRLPGPGADTDWGISGALVIDFPLADALIGNLIIQRVNRFSRVRYGRVASPYAGKIVIESLGDSLTESSRVPLDYGEEFDIDTWGLFEQVASQLNASAEFAQEVVAINKGRSGIVWWKRNDGTDSYVDPVYDVPHGASIYVNTYWMGILADETAYRWVRVLQEDYNAMFNSGTTAAALAANIHAQSKAAVAQSKLLLGNQANVRHFLPSKGKTMERHAGTSLALRNLRAAEPTGTSDWVDACSTAWYDSPETDPTLHPERHCAIIVDGGIHPSQEGNPWYAAVLLPDLTPLLAA